MEMLVLHNQRHEQFAQALASGRLTATKAYVSVGYSERGAAVSASLLRKNAKVAVRVQELQASSACDPRGLRSGRRLRNLGSRVYGSVGIGARCTRFRLDQPVVVCLVINSACSRMWHFFAGNCPVMRWIRSSTPLFPMS
jgi:hypothetical protein